MSAVTLPLQETHRRLGARLGALCGCEVALDYGDWRAEYAALAAGAGLVDLSFLAQIRVTGVDRADYLDRRLSQLVRDIAPGEHRAATLMDAVGKMEADLEVHARVEDFLLLAPPHGAGELAALLDRFVFSEDCRFADERGSHVILALVGAQAHAVEGGLPSRYVPGGVLFRVPAAEGEVLFEHLLARAARPVGWTAFNAWRIRHACPWWGIELDRETIPLEADLDEALHFDKGCYPGQETIARITNLGHPARKLVVLDGALDAPHEAGRELLSPEGKRAGALASAALLPDAGVVRALAMVKWPHRTAGTLLQGPDGDAWRVLGTRGEWRP
jgi:folate-binding protein YgfZ